MQFDCQEKRCEYQQMLQKEIETILKKHDIEKLFDWRYLPEAEIISWALVDNPRVDIRNVVIDVLNYNFRVPNSYVYTEEKKKAVGEIVIDINKLMQDQELILGSWDY